MSAPFRTPEADGSAQREAREGVAPDIPADIPTRETDQKRILRHLAEVRRIVRGLQERIRALPGPSPASGIRPLGCGCCSVRSSNLAKGVWGAETYLFKRQYERLAALAVSGDPAAVEDRLRAVVAAGRVAGKNRDSVVLHPEVVENLRRLLDGEPQREEGEGR